MNDLTVRPQTAMNEEQVKLLKDTVCKGSTDSELRLFIEVCRAKRLDPFSKQIHAVKRPAKNDRGEWVETMTFQTGIDGYRLIAERTGQYAGQDQPMWCGSDGDWKEVWASKEPPFAARAAVYRHGFAKPMVRIARYDAYVQTRKGDGGKPVPNAMWAKMGPEQLHKCAESLALRAAFPEELSGLYTTEEMGQAENGSRDAQKEVAEQKIAELAGHRQLPPPENIAEAELLDEPPEPAKKPKATIGKNFDILKAFREQKELMVKEMGKAEGERMYYGVLANHGAEKSSEITDINTARTVFRELISAYKDWKSEQPVPEGL